MNNDYKYILNDVEINKDDISFDGNTVIIDNIVESNSYQFIEINNPSNKLYLSENCKPITIEFDQFEDYNYDNFQVKSIDNDGLELGNYLYKVTSRDLVDITISGSGNNYTVNDLSQVKKGYYVFHDDLPYGTRITSVIEPNQIILSNQFSSEVSNVTVNILFVPDNNKILLNYNNENIGNNYLDRINFANNLEAEIYDWIIDQDKMVFTLVTKQKLLINPDILKVYRDNSLESISFTKIEYISEILFNPSYYHNL